MLQSSAGLKLWGTDRDDTPAVFELAKELPKTLRLALSDLRKRLGTDKGFRVTAVDAYGRQTVVDAPANSSSAEAGTR